MWQVSQGKVQGAWRALSRTYYRHRSSSLSLKTSNNVTLYFQKKEDAFQNTIVVLKLIFILAEVDLSIYCLY